MEEKKRLYLYDNLKFFLILCVVVGHIVDTSGMSDIFRSIYLFIYTFHMPLFIFISGHFHKNTNIRQRVISFVTVGLALKAFISLANFLIKSNTPSFKLLMGSDISWYLFATAAFILISYLLRDAKKPAVLIMFIIIGCFIGYDSTVGDYFSLSRIIVFYPFYLLGEMTSESQIQSIRKKPLVKIVSAVILLAIFITCFFMIDKVYYLRPLFTGRNSFKVNELFKTWGFAYRLLCFAISSLACFSLLMLAPGRKLPFISNAGSKTLQVYFWHFPVIILLRELSFCDYLYNTTAGNVILLLIAVAITVILCIPVFRYPVKWLLSAFNKPKKISDEKENAVSVSK